jgi:hypothetical protein
MPRFSPQQKSAAAANLDTAQRIATFSGFFTVAVAAIPGPGPLLALAPAAVGAAYGSRAIAQGKIVRDPPDPDFRSPARLGPVELNLDLVGDSPFESAVGELALSNERAAAAARALVRSLERAMGAEEAGEKEYVRERLGDCDEYARRFAAELSNTAELAFAARGTVRELPPLGSPVRGDSLVLERLLPPETLAGLYRMGVRRSYVAEPLKVVDDHVPPGDVREGWSELLAASGEADAAYAAAVHRQLQAETLWLPDEEELPA